MKTLGWVVLLAAAWIAPARAADPPLRFWNQTDATINRLHLAPAGTDRWGPNQCEYDDDKDVSSSERLRLVGVTPGRYDVRLSDTRGRTCTVRNVEVKAGGRYAFAIGNQDLTDCTK